MLASRPSRFLVALAAAALTVTACSPEPMERVEDQTTAPPPAGSETGAPTVSSPVPAGLEEYYGQDVAWEECGDFDCADVTVPLDYEEPDGESITLAVKRLPSTESSRVGSLLVNPGGPGSSALDLVDAAAGMFGADLLAAYDIVGFDPRGVGESTAIDCVGDAELDRLRGASYDTETDEGLRAFAADAQLIADGCAANSGELVGHVDTVSAARDMDVLRHLLGEEQLDYLGFSYGTYLGATYADLFPEQVGNLVLDGGMDPSLDLHQTTLDQAVGFEEALRAYVEDCQGGSECPLTGDVDNGVAQVQTLLEVTADTPLPTSTDRELTASLAFSGILLPLYDSSTWFVLTAALNQAMNERDGSQLLFLADLMAGREADGTYSNNSTEANWAINCLDHPSSGELADWKAEAGELTEAAPTFGPALGYGGMLCQNWPAEGTEAGARTAAGSAPIMVVGTTGDPATPYEWSVSLSEQLENGFLVTYEGEGHTAYGRSNECVASAVEDFLINSTVPQEGLTC